VKKVILLIAVLVAAATVTQVAAISKLQVKWAFNTSAQFEGKSFGAGHQGCQTVYDIDGDGKNEIIFGTRRGDSKRLWCIEQDGTFQWIYPPLGEDGLPGDPTSKVSLVDVDNDGTYEVCLAGRGGRLHVLNPDGSIKWTWDNPDAGTAMHGAPQAYDVDGDGYVEFFMNSNSGFIDRIDHNGNSVWRSFQCGDDNQGQPTIADIDRDGEYEVLWASQDHNLYCINAQTGAEEWRFDTGANMQTNQVIVADVNNDGEYEAIVWTDAVGDTPGTVYCVSFYGTELWRWTLPTTSNIRICQAMGDLNGDGNLDLAVNSGAGGFGIDISGAAPVTLWHVNFTDLGLTVPELAGATSNHWSSYQLIADIDADGKQEVLWLSPFPIVTDAATGQVEAYYLNEHIAVNRRQENGGWWGDVDKDGKSEWIAELNGNSHPETQVYCMTENGAFPADAWWPEYYHCAAADQQAASWLKLKASASNSLWFPMPELLFPTSIAGLLGIVLLRRRD